MVKQVVDTVRKFIHFLQYDLWRSNQEHDSRLKTFGVEVLRVTHLVLKGVKEDNCLLHASALTYATLMALAPFLIIVFSIANAIGYAAARERILSALEANEAFPDQLKDFIIELLNTIGGISVAALGGITGVVFLYIVFKLLSGIEESFNQIWGVQTSRAISEKVRNYISVLVIAPALMLLAQFASGAMTTYFSGIEWMGPFIRVLLQVAPVFVLALAFVAIFIFLPNTKVEFKAALIGALTSATLAILLQIALLVFGKAIFGSDKYAVYGSFAAIPVFLFWVHLNWTILLFGAELAFAIQNRKTYQEEQRAVRASMVSKLWVAFSVMREAVRVFEGPDPSFDSKRFAQENNIPVRLLNEVIEVLVRARLLGLVTSEGQDQYALLQAPEHVSAKKIYDLLLSDGEAPDDLGLHKIEVTDEVLATANISLDESLDPITLRRFFDRQ
ncbi:MAG: YihY/virulence factor BrkB family protein [Pontiellaceae bacterium]|nr:YihY/virulence factor BrkB family protein [Pontiellaceae bacterium]MBN2784341.1 YihY/virulence factor BrkB family protein [Pontiellaceae bacterium]